MLWLGYAATLLVVFALGAWRDGIASADNFRMCGSLAGAIGAGYVGAVARGHGYLAPASGIAINLVLVLATRGNPVSLYRRNIKERMRRQRPYDIAAARLGARPSAQCRRGRHPDCVASSGACMVVDARIVS